MDIDRTPALAAHRFPDALPKFSVGSDREVLLRDVDEDSRALTFVIAETKFAIPLSPENYRCPAVATFGHPCLLPAALLSGSPKNVGDGARVASCVKER
jgi:hypothetical protein